MNSTRYLPALFAFVAIALFAGCSGPSRVPARIALPVVTNVRASVAAAKASNAKAANLAKQAVEKGIRANSDEARELSLATAATDSELTLALARLDVLTTELLRAQTQVDDLAKHDAFETARADKEQRRANDAESAYHRVRWLLILFGVAGVAAIGLMGTTLETLTRAGVSAAVGALAILWHFLLGLFLRFWPLILAAV